MDAERYRHLTYDITMAAATTLAKLNPQMVFTYVTGRGTDSTEQGSLRWARVKGKTENDLLKLPFKAAYMFRPAGIQPLHGVRSKTGWINAIYVVSAPLLSYLTRIAPGYMTTIGKTRPRHDQGRARWLSEADTGERGYQSLLIVIPGRARRASPESSRCQDSDLRIARNDDRSAPDRRSHPGTNAVPLASVIVCTGAPYSASSRSRVRISCTGPSAIRSPPRSR